MNPSRAMDIPPYSANRRAFLRGSLAAVASLAAGCRTSAERSGSAPRPNLLFILTDDQRWDMLGCARHPFLKTPHMDALAREGTRFTRAFVTTAICAASRASIFTGLVERTHGFTFGTPPVPPRYVEITYPLLLRRAGYRTGFIGKFGVKMGPDAPRRLFDHFEEYAPGNYWVKQPDGTVRHKTDLMGDSAAAFLRACTPERPFCLSLSFNAPHADDPNPRQYVWPHAEDGLYDAVTVPPPRLGEPAFFDARPAFLRESLNRVRWHWRFDTPGKYQEMVKGYCRMITGVDRVIGRIRAELERLGLAENTVLLLMGDNGYFLGDRGYAGKWLPYEDALRVPLIAYDPRPGRSRRGSTPAQMALNIDIAPTLLDLAGVPAPATMQGRSLLPLLRGDRPPWRHDFFFEHLFEHPKIPKCEGVRTERWKYIRYFEHRYEELYDLERDPLEAHDLARKPEHQATLERLRRRCDALRDRYGGIFRPRKAQKQKPA